MPKTKERKRREAEERRVVHARRTPEDQLARTEDRPGNSERERDKLLHRIEQRRTVK